MQIIFEWLCISIQDSTKGDSNRCTAYSQGLAIGYVKGKGTDIIVVESPYRYGKSHAIWDHAVVPATWQW